MHDGGTVEKRETKPTTDELCENRESSIEDAPSRRGDGDEEREEANREFRKLED
jgi:hypothetical protein